MFLKFQRAHVYDKKVIKNLTAYIKKTMVFTGYKEDKQLIILCIGTDRSTGDSLGPLIGSKLLETDINAVVMGDIHNPCHGANIEEYIAKIKNDYDNPYIIAID